MSDEYHPSSGDDEEVAVSDSDEDYTSLSEASASGDSHVTAGMGVCANSMSFLLAGSAHTKISHIFSPLHRDVKRPL